MIEQAPVIRLDRLRTLRYSCRSLRLAEDGAKKHLGELLITHAGVASAAWLLWGGLIHDDEAFQKRQDPTLTVDDVCDLLDVYWFSQGRTLKELSPLYTEAIVQCGIFSRPPAGKAPPEAALEPLASGSETGSTT